jgi:ribokinase
MTPLLWILGNLTIDDVVLADGTTAMGLCGGNAIYAALGARLWEERVGLAARIGPDYPLVHIARVREAGVHMALVEVARPSIHDWALYETEGVRRFINWVGSGSHLDQSIRAAELPESLSSAPACHVAPMPLAVQASLVAALRERGVRIVALDPHEEYIEGHEDELLALLAAVDVFLPSRRETELLYGRDDPEAAVAAFAAAGADVVAIKLGAEGSLVSVPGEPPRHVPAVPVPAIDPTGCGDAFCGGFLAAYRRGADALTAACHGTVSASFTVETRGALAMLPLDHATAGDRLEQLFALVRPLPAPERSLDPSAAKGQTYAHG